MVSEQLEANQIVKLAFGPSFEDESEEAKVLRRILRRQIEGLLSKSLDEKIIHNLNQIAEQLKIAMTRKQEMYRNEEIIQNLRSESTYLRQQEVSGETDSSSERFNTIAAFAVLATAVAGGILFSSIPGAIVSAAAVPLILKILESFNRTSRTQRTSK